MLQGWLAKWVGNKIGQKMNQGGNDANQQQNNSLQTGSNFPEWLQQLLAQSQQSNNPQAMLSQPSAPAMEQGRASQGNEVMDWLMRLMAQRR